MHYREISRRLVICIIATFILLIVIFGAVGYFYSQKILRENYFAGIKTELSLVDGQIQDMFREISHDVDQLAADPVISMVNADLTTELLTAPEESQGERNNYRDAPGITGDVFLQLEEYASYHPHVAYAYVGSLWGGYVQWPSGDLVYQYDPRTRPWFEQSMANKEQAVRSEPYLSLSSFADRSVIISTTKAVRNAKGEFVGVVGIDYSLESFAKKIASIKLVQNGYMFITDSSGRIIAHPDSSLIMQTALDEGPEGSGGGNTGLVVRSFKKLPGSQEHFVATKIDGQRVWVSTYISKATGWQLVAVVPSQDIAASSGEMALVFVLGGLMVFLVSLVITLLLLRFFSKRLGAAEKSIYASEERFRTFFQLSGAGCAIIDAQGRWVEYNDKLLDMLGYSREELGQMTWQDITPEAAMQEEFVRFKKAVADDARGNHIIEKQYICKDGHRIDVLVTARGIVGASGQVDHYISTIMDVTRAKDDERALRESEERYRYLTEAMLEGLLVIDYTGQVVMINDAAARVAGFASAKDVNGIDLNFADFMHHDSLPYAVDDFQKIMRGASVPIAEYKTIGVDGVIRWVEAKGTMIELNGTPADLVLLHDITERKIAEADKDYLLMHDSLTGLNNRRFFEKSIHGIMGDQVAIIVADVDGLKLINDALGHEAGDKLLRILADILEDVFGSLNQKMRIGGDEFAVIAHQVSKEEIQGLLGELGSKIDDYNQRHPELPLSISIGYTLKEGRNISGYELMREADSFMYREKLRHQKGSHGAIVETLMKALETRDFVTKDHSTRLEKLITAIAQRLGFPDGGIHDLILLGKFHDLGKVGIADKILFKPGPLDDEEWAEMRRHPELGYRIAVASPQLTPIAEWILKHQERWDGKGYPLGLAREAIPIECRIISVLDAYDAMRNDRPYRAGMSRKEAEAELIRCAGTQFDPGIVEVFLEVLQESPET